MYSIQHPFTYPWPCSSVSFVCFFLLLCALKFNSFYNTPWHAACLCSWSGVAPSSPASVCILDPKFHIFSRSLFDCINYSSKKIYNQIPYKIQLLFGTMNIKIWNCTLLHNTLLPSNVNEDFVCFFVLLIYHWPIKHSKIKLSKGIWYCEWRLSPLLCSMH
jgi:hypothetical protein